MIPFSWARIIQLTTYKKHISDRISDSHVYYIYIYYIYYILYILYIILYYIIYVLWNKNQHPFQGNALVIFSSQTSHLDPHLLQFIWDRTPTLKIHGWNKSNSDIVYDIVTILILYIRMALVLGWAPKGQRPRPPYLRRNSSSDPLGFFGICGSDLQVLQPTAWGIPYPPVNVYIANWKITLLLMGKSHCFYGHGFNSFLLTFTRPGKWLVQPTRTGYNWFSSLTAANFCVPSNIHSSAVWIAGDFSGSLDQLKFIFQVQSLTINLKHVWVWLILWL